MHQVADGRVEHDLVIGEGILPGDNNVRVAELRHTLKSIGIDDGLWPHAKIGKHLAQPICRHRMHMRRLADVRAQNIRHSGAYPIVLGIA